MTVIINEISNVYTELWLELELWLTLKNYTNNYIFCDGRSLSSKSVMFERLLVFFIDSSSSFVQLLVKMSSLNRYS